MTRVPSPTPRLIGALWVVGLGSLAAITLPSLGATRMHAWPWSLAQAAALACPVILLLLRAFDPRRPLATPARAWMIAVLAGAGAVLASALASPYRAASLPWGAPLLAAAAHFLAVFDWLHADPEEAPRRRTRLFTAVVAGLAAVAVVSMAGWVREALRGGLDGALASRNALPLGHANYTAGLALLLLPGAVALAGAGRGAARIAGATAATLALAMLFSSGSRAGAVGLAVLLVAALLAARLPWRRKLLLAATATAIGAIFVAANPRTRTLFTPADPAAAPNPSNVQRSAMLTAGVRMGLERPLLGWGPGTTPLAYPRFRAGLDGGVENALQLHSTPVQLWAELGGAGVAAALALAALAAGAASRQPAAAATLAAYAAFACLDWQLDVPVFALTLATLAALLAPPGEGPSRGGKLAGSLALGGLALIAILGRGDPTPGLNTRALQLAARHTPEAGAQAVALLGESLARNPDQEIAHFNLGWLLVTADPARASRHFRAAARLVPDKGGVYFGLGLAALNSGRPESAAPAFALELLNDPAFLSSPWWQTPAVAATRDASLGHLREFLRRAAAAVPPGSWAAVQLNLVGQAARLPPPPTGSPERAYRRERTGYPVLMRNLDLAPPVDVWLVRESAAAPAAGWPALPPKGWLPSPLLLALLDEAVPSGP